MTEHRRKSDRWLTALLGGLFLLGGCGLFATELMDEERHAFHLSAAMGLAVFGAGMLSPDAIYSNLKRLGQAAKGLLPWAGKNEPPSAGPSGG